MKILGLLNFYDEPRESLLSCLASLAKIGVTHIVAVDGAYALFPDGRPGSPPEQQAAIVMACRDLGMGCTLHVPAAVWDGNEPAKRSFLFYLALANADPGDWFMVMDADQTVVRYPDDLFDRLDGTDAEVASVTFAEDQAIYTRRILFAAQPIFVRGNHYTYVTVDGRYLWADRTLGQEAAVNLTDMVILHRPQRRSDGRTAAKKEFYDVRDASGAELVDCRHCGNGLATKRLPERWRKEKGVVKGDWTEVCDPCGKKLEQLNRVRLRQLGLRPDDVTARTVVGPDVDLNMIS